MLTGTKQPEKHCIINKQANTFYRSLRKENHTTRVTLVTNTNIA